MKLVLEEAQRRQQQQREEEAAPGAPKQELEEKLRGEEEERRRREEEESEREREREREKERYGWRGSAEVDRRGAAAQGTGRGPGEGWLTPVWGFSKGQCSAGRRAERVAPFWKWPSLYPWAIRKEEPPERRAEVDRDEQGAEPLGLGRRVSSVHVVAQSGEGRAPCPPTSSALS